MFQSSNGQCILPLVAKKTIINYMSLSFENFPEACQLVVKCQVYSRKSDKSYSYFYTSLFRFLHLSYSSSRRNHELKKQFIYKVLNKAKSAELQDSARGHSTAVLVTHEQKDLSPNPPLLQDTSAEQQVDVFSPSSLIFH